MVNPFDYFKHPTTVSFLFILFFMINPAANSADANCGPPNPNEDDYWHPRDDHLKLVEQYHFGPEVEFLRAPLKGLAANLDYTLRHFPNHPRALLAVSKLERRLGGQYPQLKTWTWHRSAECYFKRAIRLRPDDPNVYQLIAIDLHLKGSLDEALKAYKQAETLAPNSASNHYNLGLLYFDRENYDLAKTHAQKAYKLGYKLPGLREKLAQVGKWP